MPTPLTQEEKNLLLAVARQSIENAVAGRRLPTLALDGMPPALRENGASFVTLTRQGQLRGCVGSLAAHQPLFEDVRQRAMQAAVDDTRFPPVSAPELKEIEIEISCLQPAVPLEYDDPASLPALLRPGKDGVVLSDGRRRATFLPQVWDQLPRAEDFLSHLCAKMGASPDLWRRKALSVLIYEVEEFSEVHRG